MTQMLGSQLHRAVLEPAHDKGLSCPPMLGWLD